MSLRELRHCVLPIETANPHLNALLTPPQKTLYVAKSFIQVSTQTFVRTTGNRSEAQSLTSLFHVTSPPAVRITQSAKPILRDRRSTVVHRYRFVRTAVLKSITKRVKQKGVSEDSPTATPATTVTSLLSTTSMSVVV